MEIRNNRDKAMMVAAITGISVIFSVTITFIALGFKANVTMLAIATLVPVLVAPVASSFAAAQMLHAYTLNQRLLHLLDHDQMTQLFNRGAFFTRLQEAPGQNSAILMFDIDRFKTINDTHGHAVGDAAICLVADALRSAVGTNGFAARLGGEEFAIFARDMSVGQAHDLAERVRRTVAGQRVVPGDDTARLTVSAGIARFGEGQDVDAAIRAADAALYQSKKRGRNCVTVRAAA